MKPKQQIACTQWIINIAMKQVSKNIRLPECVRNNRISC